ncbi:YheC/YheD family protein [Mycoplasmatota bacterium]|nr:YheC/YheD family protein [Mycoplasmatota bacterium]
MRWVKIVSSGNNLAYFPKTLKRHKIEFIKVGHIKKDIEIVYYESSIDALINDCYEIKLPDEIIEMMYIDSNLKYQFFTRKGIIEIGPIIGFLLGNSAEMYTIQHMERYLDRLGIYDKIQGLVTAFTPKNIDYDKMTACGLYYHPENGWIFGEFPLPKILYRRSFRHHTNDIKKLKAVLGNEIYNSDKLIKGDFYNLIKRNKKLSRYLPKTSKCKDFELVDDFLYKYRKVILKPTNSSRGRGICVIEETDKNFIVYDYRVKDGKMRTFNDLSALRNFFNKNPMFFHNYLVQEYIDLAELDGGKFDIRVVIQKNLNDKWDCTGIECRVSTGKEITNVAQGSYIKGLIFTLTKVFKLELGETLQYKKKIIKLCIDTARHIESDRKYIEFGMDIAIDKKKNLWLLEANVRPSFTGFKSLDYSSYLKIRYRPLLYSTIKSGFKIY